MKRGNPFDEIYSAMNSDKNLPQRLPYIIDIELTNKCNLSCNFCSRQLMKRKQGFMDDSTFRRILSQIEEVKIPIRFIRWGEPFLHPKIITYANNLTKRGIPLHITTNGLLLNGEICDKIVSCGIDSITFSMQGLTKIDYQRERNNEKYNLLRKNIKMLCKIRNKSENPFISVSTTYTPTLDSDGIDFVYEKKFKDYWKKYVDNVEVGITNYARLKDFKGSHIICKEPWQKLSIDWDGNVSACCGDYDRLLNIGNINDESLYDLWTSDILKSYRNLISKEKHQSLTLCSKCYPAYGDVWKSG